MRLDDAVPVPQGTTELDMLRLVHERFPEYSQFYSDLDNFEPGRAETYLSYGRLAEKVLERKDDKVLLQRISSFINEMVVSKDFWPKEIAGDVLESLAQDASLAAGLYSGLVPQAQELLKAIERGMHGRVSE